MARKRSNWKRVRFGTLTEGTFFRASKSHRIWWVKKTDRIATSINGQLETVWDRSDLVWIDLSSVPNRARYL